MLDVSPLRAGPHASYLERAVGKWWLIDACTSMPLPMSAPEGQSESGRQTEMKLAGGKVDVGGLAYCAT